jgi:hypothetical protein
MKQDEVNTIVENVFTSQEVNDIYKAVQNNSGGSFIKNHAQANTFIKLPDAIIEKVTGIARSVSGNDRIVLAEYCHARYNNVTSNCGKFHYKPSLFPHYDETFKEPRFTFDYQIQSNVEWPLVVEPDQSFTLKDNQAVTFSGTHQIHWREPKHFADNEFVEMVFFHFLDPEAEIKDPEINKVLNEKASMYMEQFFANGGFTNDDSE